MAEMTPYNVKGVTCVDKATFPSVLWSFIASFTVFLSSQHYSFDLTTLISIVSSSRMCLFSAKSSKNPLCTTYSASKQHTDKVKGIW